MIKVVCFFFCYPPFSDPRDIKTQKLEQKNSFASWYLQHETYCASRAEL